MIISYKRLSFTINKLSYIHSKTIYTHIYLRAHLTCWHYTSQVIFSWVFLTLVVLRRYHRQRCHRAEVPVESRSANCLEVVDWPSRTRMPRAVSCAGCWKGQLPRYPLWSETNSTAMATKPTYVHFVCRMVRVQTRIDFLLQDIMITSIIWI